jgi:hypothetical protein
MTKTKPEGKREGTVWKGTMMRPLRYGNYTIWRDEKCVLHRDDANPTGVVLQLHMGRFTILKAPEFSNLLRVRLKQETDKELFGLFDGRLIERLKAKIWEMMLTAERRGVIEPVEPTYEHDCDACFFLGRSVGYMDLYYCDHMDRHMPTIIARYGNDGPEYKSGLPIAITGTDRDLTEGLIRAIDAGFFLGREGPLEGFNPTPYVHITSFGWQLKRDLWDEQGQLLAQGSA